MRRRRQVPEWAYDAAFILIVIGLYLMMLWDASRGAR